jgi:hypothetical protein
MRFSEKTGGTALSRMRGVSTTNAIPAMAVPSIIFYHAKKSVVKIFIVVGRWVLEFDG